jgi:PBSX family phage terminase large subunit
MVPFGKKAKQFICRPPAKDAFINILQGSVRSGKTWAMIPKLLALCKYKVAGQRVIVGVSKQTIYNNILSDLFDFIGERNYTFNRQTGELVLFGVKWLVIGAKDEGSEKYIRGLTVGIAYVDEATLTPESAFKMLVSRLSPEGARLYCTTNPDTPFHYLKVDYIDNEAMRSAGDVWCEHFTLHDNLSLSPATRARYERMYTGVFFKRFILGLWVIAEGVIYRDSLSDDNYYDDASRPVGLLGQGGSVGRYIPIDYGTANQTVFLDVIDDGKTYWVEDEYVWDSRKESLQKTDKQYADDLAQWIANKRGAQIIVDPSAASFKVELTQRGIWHMDAVNDVLDGIRTVSSLLAQRKIRIHKRCKNLDQQLQTYAWDEKAAKLGEEKPIKKNDHGPDGLRYFAQTAVPQWRLTA